MRATYRDGDERTLQLLNRPNTDDPSFETRFEWLLAHTDTLCKEITAAGHGGLVSSFTISVTASEREKTIPRDDFEALFHAYDQRTGRVIPVINTPDARRWGVGELPGYCQGSDVLALGWRGTGDDRRLVVYPSGASGTLTVYYVRSINQISSPDETIDVLDTFELVLVPASVAMYGMGWWKWSRYSDAEQERIRAMALDERNAASLAGLYKRQYNRFIDRIYNPFRVAGEDRATSRHAVSQILRHSGREY